MINHFQYNEELTKKSNMFINLQTFSETIKENVFLNVPITFNLEINSKKQNLHFSYLRNFFAIFKIMDSCKELFKSIYKGSEDINTINNQLQLRFQSNAKFIKQRESVFPTGFDKKGIPLYTKFTMPLCHFVGNNLWLLKPTSFNRGRGIHVFNNVDKLKELLNFYTLGKSDEVTNYGSESK